MRLTRDFYSHDTVEVARMLVGKIFVCGEYQGLILETEAYRGHDDPACHAFRGITPRTQVMFGNPGYSYVYFIYGMYHCFNIVTEVEGVAAAVLIRAIQLTKWPGQRPFRTILNGPGKLCKDLEITRLQNGVDMTISQSLYCLSEGVSLEYKATPRIGIRLGQEKLWRFVAKPLPNLV